MSEIDDKQKLVNLNDLKYVRAYVDLRVAENNENYENFKNETQENYVNFKNEIEEDFNNTSEELKAQVKADVQTEVSASLSEINNELDSIEERLTLQGFNEGSASLGPGISATQNRLTRQGHHAIFRFVGKCTGDGGGENGVYYFTLPDGFIPNESFSMRVMTLRDGLAISQVTAATLVFKKENPVVELWYYYYGGTIYDLSFQAGYETVPVVTGDGGSSGGDDDDTTMEV